VSATGEEHGRDAVDDNADAGGRDDEGASGCFGSPEAFNGFPGDAADGHE